MMPQATAAVLQAAKDSLAAEAHAVSAHAANLDAAIADTHADGDGACDRCNAVRCINFGSAHTAVASSNIIHNTHI